eukprot:COSAG02_NODE_2772_length_8058_cov_64.441513_2_plen_76_part_00
MTVSKVLRPISPDITVVEVHELRIAHTHMCLLEVVDHSHANFVCAVVDAGDMDCQLMPQHDRPCWPMCLYRTATY